MRGFVREEVGPPLHPWIYARVSLGLPSSEPDWLIPGENMHSMIPWDAIKCTISPPVCSSLVAKDSNLLRADSEASVFTGRTGQFGFVVLRLKWLP